MKELREMIRDLRADHDLKQEALAKYLNIKQQTYSSYETGRLQIPAWVVVELAKYYKVSTDYLLGADTSYLESVNLSKQYLADITLYDVVYEIKGFKPHSRRELMRFIKYLKSTEEHEAERESK